MTELQFIRIGTVCLYQVQEMLDIVVVTSLNIEIERDISVLDPHSVLRPNATAIQGQHVRSVIGIIFRSQVRSDRFGQKGIHS